MEDGLNGGSGAFGLHWRPAPLRFSDSYDGHAGGDTSKQDHAGYKVLHCSAAAWLTPSGPLDTLQTPAYLCVRTWMPWHFCRFVQRQSLGQEVDEMEQATRPPPLFDASSSVRSWPLPHRHDISPFCQLYEFDTPFVLCPGRNPPGACLDVLSRSSLATDVPPLPSTWRPPLQLSLLHVLMACLRLSLLDLLPNTDPYRSSSCKCMTNGQTVFTSANQ
ncbi:hypothetical protein J3F83DRAFT_416429 [Trichoderma novae-zelandiae]